MGNSTDSGQKNMDEHQLLEACKKVLLDHVAPALEINGSSIEVIGLDGKILQLRLGTICGNCPSTIQAMLFGIETELRKHLPEIEFVEAIP